MTDDEEELGTDQVPADAMRSITAGDWRLRAVATLALGIPSLAGGGKLSQASDRLYSHGSVDRRRLFTWCGGGGRL